MVYEIGAYVIDPGKDFTDVNEAVQYIQGLYPELDKDTIVKHVKPLLVKTKTLEKEINETNKSGNTSKKDKEGQKGSS